MTLADEIKTLLNRHCAENSSNTPDWILAEYLLNCLKAWDVSTNKRDKWYGVKLSPGTKYVKLECREKLTLPNIRSDGTIITPRPPPKKG